MNPWIAVTAIMIFVGSIYIAYKWGYSDGFFKAANIALKDGDMGILKEVLRGLRK